MNCMNDKRTSSGSCSTNVKVLKLVGLAVAGFVFFAAYAVYSHHFYNLDHENWTAERFSTNTTFIRKELGITYYKRGELHRVLPEGGWLSDQLDGGLHVFRLEDGEEPYPINVTELGAMPARALKDNCENLHGLLSGRNSCYEVDQSMELRKVEDIFSQESTQWYAGFADMETEAVRYMDGVTELPGKLMNGFHRSPIQHGFASNTKDPVLSASIHANPFTHSLAVQYVGRKTWVLFSGRDYLKESGFHATSLNGIMYPTKGPTTEVMTYWSFKSKPGDYLFFPSQYPHMVLTEPGPNLMVTYRKGFPGKQLWMYPIATIHAIFNRLFMSKQVKNEEDIEESISSDGKQNHGSVLARHKRFAVTEIFREYHKTLGSILNNDRTDPTTNLDRILGRLLREASENLS